MSCITIDSGASDLSGTRGEGAGRRGVFASLLRVALGLLRVCRSGAALAVMSARDLDDLGLLPGEVRAESDGGAEDRIGGARRAGDRGSGGSAR